MRDVCRSAFDDLESDTHDSDTPLVYLIAINYTRQLLN